MKIRQIANTLTEKYSWNKFRFGAQPGTKNWRWRYLISCILVGGNNEADTLRCDEELFEKFPTPEALAKAKFRTLADLIESYGLEYAGKKAAFIVGAAKRVIELGDVPDNREGLEDIPGVGRHVASVILATCYGQQEFAVDIHVRRIAKRLKLVSDSATDLQIEKEIRSLVPAKQWGHFSRSFVDFGQTICGYAPKCGSCFFKKDCTHASEKALGRSAFKLKKSDGAYRVRTHTIQVNNGYAKCDCMAGKFGRNCKHLKELAA